VEFLLRLRTSSSFANSVPSCRRSKLTSDSERSRRTPRRNGGALEGALSEDAATVEELSFYGTSSSDSPRSRMTEGRNSDGLEPWDPRMISLARFDRIAAAENFSGRSPDFTKTAVLIPILAQRISLFGFRCEARTGSRRPTGGPVPSPRHALGATRMSGASTNRSSAGLSGRTIRPRDQLLSIQKFLHEMDRPGPVARA
jgi:hypothetical protein